MKTFGLLAVSVVLTSCASFVSTPLVVSGETLLIQGNILESTAIEFQQALSQRRISRILIASGGGLVEPALTIASEIRDRKLEVEVVGPCFSSCANYIFPAGATKTISGLGVVAWHGNMTHLLYLHMSGVKPLDPKNLAEVQRLVRSENSFFASIGLDQFICWFGKVDPYNVRNMYFLSAADMAGFGLNDVKVRPGYEHTDLSSHNNRAVNMQYVKVDWSSLQLPVAAR